MKHQIITGSRDCSRKKNIHGLQRKGKGISTKLRKRPNYDRSPRERCIWAKHLAPRSPTAVAAAKELPRPWPRIWGSVRAESLPRRGGAGARVEPCRCSILRPLAALPKVCACCSFLLGSRFLLLGFLRDGAMRLPGMGLACF